MKFALTILGANSAVPAHGRHLTSQVLQFNNHFFLIDCGEGTQMRMSDFGVPRHKIQQIFISHLHGDHIFGLPGLLFSYALNNRRQALDIYSPPGLEEMVLAQLKPGGALTFPLRFHLLDPTKYELIFENQFMTVHALPLRHRIPTVGFVFREKQRQHNMRPEKIDEYQLSIPQIKAAKAGYDVLLDDGRNLPNAELTFPPPLPRSFAFVSDSAYDETILPYIEGVNLLYHETTFCHDMEEYAELTLHSTARQAAAIAQRAGAGKLITGHYSSRYKDLQPFLVEAQAVFPQTELGLEGNEYEVPFR
jgi:ribonuclease Z